MATDTKNGKLSLLSCPSKGTTARASSILNRNASLYGPMNALHTQDRSSCWNSDQAPRTAPPERQQIFQVFFNRDVSVDNMRIMFQGGFVPLHCEVSASKDGTGGFEPLSDVLIEPEDGNEMQEFDLRTSEDDGDSNDEDFTCRALRLDFGESTDFYGRVTIYRLEIWGREKD